MGYWRILLLLLLPLAACEFNTRAPLSDAGPFPGDAAEVAGADADLTDAGAEALDAALADAGSLDGGLAPDASLSGRDAAGSSPDAAAPGPCARLAVAPATLSGYSTDRYTWSDSVCRPRSAALVRNDASDPGGSKGGFLKEYAYEVGGKTRTCKAQGGLRWNGWGYVVTHYGSGSTSSHDTAGSWRTVFAGEHHALHEFKVRISPGGPVDVTVQWVFATGRDHPLFAITLDSSANVANKLAADTRAPYGNLSFDGVADGSGAVAGVGWGDRFRFETTGPGPASMASPWDYSQPNTIPYVVEWAAAADAEMGAVETRPFAQGVSAGDYGGGLLAECWARTSANPGTACPKDAAGDSMFASWLWPYQLNQYELPFTTTSKRLAWGANYGAVGQASFDSLGRTGRSGHPLTSYSVWVVLGEHSAGAVDSVVTQMEAVQATRLTASVGAVATSGIAGVGRTDTTTWSPAGWDHVYGTWDLKAAGDAARVSVEPGGTLENPVFRVLDFGAAAPKSVQLGGALLQPEVDYFASVDPANRVLWLTLNRTLAGTSDLSIE